jgi:hypothetical protein
LRLSFTARKHVDSFCLVVVEDGLLKNRVQGFGFVISFAKLCWREKVRVLANASRMAMLAGKKGARKIYELYSYMNVIISDGYTGMYINIKLSNARLNQARFIYGYV